MDVRLTACGPGQRETSGHLQAGAKLRRAANPKSAVGLERARPGHEAVDRTRVEKDGPRCRGAKRSPARGHGGERQAGRGTCSSSVKRKPARTSSRAGGSNNAKRTGRQPVRTSNGVAVKRLANAVAGWVRRPAAPGQRATWPVSAEGEKNLKRGVRLSLSILATKAALGRRALDNRAGPVDAAEPLQTERSRRGR